VTVKGGAENPIILRCLFTLSAHRAFLSKTLKLELHARKELLPEKMINFPAVKMGACLPLPIFLPASTRMCTAGYTFCFVVGVGVATINQTWQYFS
jgi:hypothetical protein